MATNLIGVFMSNGDRFVITTSKLVDLKEGAPFKTVHKEATYAVVCGDTLLNKIGEVTPSWWEMLFPKKIVAHRKTGAPYLLCALDKESGISGSSTFYNGDGEEVSKSEIKQWLPSAGAFDSDHMTLPLANMLKVEPLDLVPAAPQEVPDGLPF